jgi:predicted glycosyltransferase
MTAKKVFFYVQHLLGIGHQRRGATITRAMQAAGLDVTYVSGGHEIPNLELAGAKFVQLPPVRAVDLYFKKLVDEFDQPIDDVWRKKRQAALMAAYVACEPDVIILELYPFGRRQMRFELLPLLDAAKAQTRPPVIVSSVRDILVEQPKPERLVVMLGRIDSFFDHVMVHGDADLVPFERTFPQAGEIADKLSYTGYVVDQRSETGAAGAGDDVAGQDEVLVSAGGGAVGDKLLRTAMRTRALTSLRRATWRVLVGTKVPEIEFQALAELAEKGIIVERARGDFPSLLMNCALSISQGGYNTVMESLHADCNAVIVPYAGGLETEQTLRAELLAERGLINVVEEADLTPESLALAIETAISKGGKRKAMTIRTDGADETARLITKWAG